MVSIPLDPDTGFHRRVDALQWRGKALDASASGYAFEAKGATDIYQLPAGALALAIGASTVARNCKTVVQSRAANR
jgi:hypothetical protein